MGRIGIISDTHGLLRSPVVECFKGCDLILHAGDIGKAEVLHHLREIAPVKAVRGNVDKGFWAEQLPWIEDVEFECIKIILVHDLHRLTPERTKSDVRIVISGHSHRPGIFESHGVLYINPGSAGPRRFRLSISLAILECSDKRVIPKLIELEI